MGGKDKRMYNKMKKLVNVHIQNLDGSSTIIKINTTSSFLSSSAAAKLFSIPCSYFMLICFPPSSLIYKNTK